jgi:hypothetical protein
MPPSGASLLLTCLYCATLEEPPPGAAGAVAAVRTWLSSWQGTGAVAGGMAKQGYDLQLTRYAEAGWRATFYVSGREHSPTQATGTAWERTPWRAVHVAALGALHRAISLSTAQRP